MILYQKAKGCGGETVLVLQSVNGRPVEKKLYREEFNNNRQKLVDEQIKTKIKTPQEWVNYQIDISTNNGEIDNCIDILFIWSLGKMYKSDELKQEINNEYNIAAVKSELYKQYKLLHDDIRRVRCNHSGVGYSGDLDDLFKYILFHGCKLYDEILKRNDIMAKRISYALYNKLLYVLNNAPEDIINKINDSLKEGKDSHFWSNCEMKPYSTNTVELYKNRNIAEIPKFDCNNRINQIMANMKNAKDPFNFNQYLVGILNTTALDSLLYEDDYDGLKTEHNSTSVWKSNTKDRQHVGDKEITFTVKDDKTFVIFPDAGLEDCKLVVYRLLDTSMITSECLDADFGGRWGVTKEMSETIELDYKEYSIPKIGNPDSCISAAISTMLHLEEIISTMKPKTDLTELQNKQLQKFKEYKQQKVKDEQTETKGSTGIFGLFKRFSHK
jgi:hypothetical protein